MKVDALRKRRGALLEGESQEAVTSFGESSYRRAAQSTSTWQTVTSPCVTVLREQKEAHSSSSVGENDGFAETKVARGQIQFVLNVQVDLSPDVQKTGRGVHQLNQATLLTKLNSLGIVEKLAGQFAFRLLCIDSRHDRQLMVAKLLDIIRIEADVRIDPKRFCKPISHGITGDGVSGHIDL